MYIFAGLLGFSSGFNGSSIFGNGWLRYINRLNRNYNLSGLTHVLQMVHHLLAPHEFMKSGLQINQEN